MSQQTFNLVTVLPEILLTLGAVMLILGGIGKGVTSATLRLITAISLATTAVGLALQWRFVARGLVGFGYGEMVVLDGVAVLWSTVLFIGATLVLLMGWGFIDDDEHRGPEIIALVFLATAGFMFMTSATHLMMLFLGLEVGSISLYVLTAIGKPNSDSDEASMKYFLTGSMASAVLLYGIALLYTGTGGLSFGHISRAFVEVLSESQIILAGPLAGQRLGIPVVAVVGGALLLAGLLFKVTAVPFHFWAPDVYQGAPGRLVGFIAVSAKVAGFATLLRLLQITLGPMFPQLQTPLSVVAVVSIVLGTLYAIRQDDARRMLAYSGIAHAGFMLIGVSLGFRDVFGNSGYPAVMFYLVTYAVTLVLAFGIVAIVSGDSRAPIDGFKGLASTSPLMAAGLSVFMISMSGMPLTTGFVGKLGIFSAAWVAGFRPLVVIALIMSVIAFFFYLRLIVAMYFEEGSPRVEVNLGQRVAVLFGIAVTLGLGAYPKPLFEFVTDIVGL